MTDPNTGERTSRTAELTWVRLMRVHQQIDHLTATVMKRHGLSVARFDVLNHAGVRDGRTQQELADAMFVTKGNICQLLDGMEIDGLLYRRRRGRTNHIFLTEKGQQLRAAALNDQLALIDDAMSALPDNDQQQLQRLLRTIDRNLPNVSERTSA